MIFNHFFFSTFNLIIMYYHYYGDSMGKKFKVKKKI